MLFYVVKDALLSFNTCPFAMQNMLFYIGKHALCVACV